jgi:hypothetical protein
MPATITVLAKGSSTTESVGEENSTPASQSTMSPQLAEPRVEPISSTQALVAQENKGNGFWKLVRFGLLAGAAIVAGAVAVSLLSSHSEEKPSTDVTSSTNDQWIHFSDNDILAINIYLQCHEVELWSHYEAHRKAIDAEIQAELSECFSSEMEVALVFQKGSLWAKIVTRIKSAWDSFGNYIKTEGEKLDRKLNISKITQKIQKVFKNSIAKTKQILTSPQAKTTCKVFVQVVHIGSSLATILGFIDPEHQTALSAFLDAWINGGNS